MLQINGISILLLILLSLLVLQSVGGVFQIRNYKKAVRRVHRLGNVGIGQKRGRLLNGHVVIIACDNTGIITGAEAMDGVSVLARFHPIDRFIDRELIGSSIFDFLDITAQFTEKQFKHYKGYIRALEALEVRLTDRELTREQEKHRKKRSVGAMKKRNPVSS